MKVNPRSLLPLAFASAILCSLPVSSQAAVMVADFAGGTWPVQGWGVSSLSTSTDPAPGSGPWGSVTVGQYWGQMTIPSWASGNVSVANLNGNSKVEFDLILPSSGWLSGNVTIDLGLYIDSSNDSVSNGVDYGPAAASYDISGTKDQIIHFAIDYSAAGILPDAAGGGPDLNLNIYPNYNWMWDGGNSQSISYTPQQFYIDNIALTSVPEPSAAAALGAMGVLGLLRRRRRF